MFADVGVDPNADIDEVGLEADIQRQLAEQEEERHNPGQLCNMDPNEESDDN